MLEIYREFLDVGVEKRSYIGNWIRKVKKQKPKNQPLQTDTAWHLADSDCQFRRLIILTQNVSLSPLLSQEAFNRN